MAAKILGVSGSLREKSHSRRLMQLLLEKAEDFGAETRLVDLRAMPLPLYRPDEDDPANYSAIRESILSADAIAIGCPDYHGSASGTVKNFLDYYWREFAGKLFGTIVASHEKGLTVTDHLRTAIRQCYGWSLPYGIGFNGDAEMDLAAGTIAPALESRIEAMARDLTVYGGLLGAQFRADVSANPRPPGFARKWKLD